MTTAVAEFVFLFAAGYCGRSYWCSLPRKAGAGGRGRAQLSWRAARAGAQSPPASTGPGNPKARR